MTCARCNTSRLVEIAVLLAGRKVTMRSCSRCDRRWWESGGERLELPGVLDLAATR